MPSNSIVGINPAAFMVAAASQTDLESPSRADRVRVSVAGHVRPAYDVGGDAFDYAASGSVLDFAVFDAMGHGAVSSRLARVALSSYRESRHAGLDLGPTYQAMDAAVASHSAGEEFVTCILARLDLPTGVLHWINVGHPLPLLVRAGEVVGPLRCEPTLPAGLGSSVARADAVAEVARAVLSPGDRLLCITDGVVEPHRAGGEGFSEAQLAAFLRSCAQAGWDAAETVRRLSEAVVDHHGALRDDTTAFVLDFH